MFEIGISNEQQSLEVDVPRLRRAIELILSDAKLSMAEISVAIIDNHASAKPRAFES